MLRFERFPRLLKDENITPNIYENITPNIYPFNKIDINRPQQAKEGINITRTSRHNTQSTITGHITASAPLWRHRLQHQRVAPKEIELESDPLAPFSNEIDVKSISSALAATSQVRASHRDFATLSRPSRLSETPFQPPSTGGLPPRV